MPDRRVRLASAAVLALAAAMTLAASALAHPVDCDDPAAKFAGWSADWSAGDQCTVAPGGPQSAFATTNASPSSPSRRARGTRDRKYASASVPTHG